MTGTRVLLMLAFAALLGSAPARAQTDPRLTDAVRLAQEGHSDSARGVTGRLLAATPTGDSLYPQILYTQAMVANDAGEMRTQLQRIVVEYPTSSWVDDAIVRLVQMDYATRNLSGAARNLEKLRSDYPASPLLTQASYWAGRVYFDQSNPTLACRWISEGLAQSQGNIELQNQLQYLNLRCSNVAVAVPDSSPVVRDTSKGAARDTSKRAATDTSKRAATDSVPRMAPAESTLASPPPADSSPVAPGKTVYRVQIAAVGNRAAAAEAEKKVRAIGLTVVTVHEGKLYKVRAGQFGSREAAQAAAAGLKVKLGGTPFVVAEP